MKEKARCKIKCLSYVLTLANPTEKIMFIRLIGPKQMHNFLSTLIPWLNVFFGLHFTSDIYTYTHGFTLGIPEGAACLCVLKSQVYSPFLNSLQDLSACCQPQARAGQECWVDQEQVGLDLGKFYQMRAGFRTWSGGLGRVGLGQDRAYDMN